MNPHVSWPGLLPGALSQRRRLICRGAAVSLGFLLGCTGRDKSTRGEAEAKVAEAETLTIASARDVDVDVSGRIYVADDRMGAIHVLDRQLREVARAGHRGLGAGAYTDLVAVRALDSTAFLVVERYHRRIDRYRWRAGIPELDTSIALPFEPWDVCVLPGGGLWVLGLYQDYRIHEIDAHGAILRSIAPVDSAVHPVIRRQVVEGRIACVPGRIVLTSAYIPRVEFIETASPGVTKGYLTPIRAQRISVTDGGQGIYIHSGPQGFHSPGRALRRGNSWVLAAEQLARVDGVAGDSVRWYRQDDAAAGWSATGQTVGRLFPIGSDSALRISQSDLGLELAVTSLDQYPWLKESVH